MKTYRVLDIEGYFGLFLDEEYEGEDEIDVKEAIMNEIMDNIGNYIDIELEEIEDVEEGEKINVKNKRLGQFKRIRKVWV